MTSSRDLPTARFVFPSAEIVLLCAAFGFQACAFPDEAAQHPAGYSVRDSGGVVLVESSAPAWEESSSWTLSEEPLLIIGRVDGPEEYLLHRVMSAIRLDDGRIVLSNNGSQELRFYDSEGQFLSASGQAGEGPGEFRNIGLLHRLGADSLAVIDFGLFRISVFDEGGDFARSFRIAEGSPELPFPDGLFADGTFLTSVHEADAPDYQELGWFRGQNEYRRYDREGKLLGSLALLPGEEYYRGTHPDGSGFTYSPNHAVRPWAAAGADTWFYGSGDRFQIEERSASGELLRILRLERERRPMPEEVAEARIDAQEGSSGSSSPLRSLSMPEFLPTHEWILVDRVGNVWMSEYVVLDEEPRWQVFDCDGRWLGQVAMPRGGRVTDIGDDYLLGVWRDDMDVETVRLYELRKPG